jgi:hypothetical protein
LLKRGSSASLSALIHAKLAQPFGITSSTKNLRGLEPAVLAELFGNGRGKRVHGRRSNDGDVVPGDQGVGQRPQQGRSEQDGEKNALGRHWGRTSRNWGSADRPAILPRTAICDRGDCIAFMCQLYCRGMFSQRHQAARNTCGVAST